MGINIFNFVKKKIRYNRDKLKNNTKLKVDKLLCI